MSKRNRVELGHKVEELEKKIERLENERTKIYNEQSERDRAFLKSILEMLVTLYLSTKTDEKEQKNRQTCLLKTCTSTHRTSSGISITNLQETVFHFLLWVSQERKLLNGS